MTDRECSFAVLLALFDLARAGLPSSRERLAGRLALSASSIDAALMRLTSARMVRGTRLTLSGLALATSLATTRTALSRPSRDRLLAA
jgi:hypothetical protein